MNLNVVYFDQQPQVIIAQWLAWPLATKVVLCSNPGKDDNFKSVFALFCLVGRLIPHGAKGPEIKFPWKNYIENV